MATATATRQPAATTLIEYADSRGRTLAVDAAAGIIRGVKVVGHESKNGRTYTREALRAAIDMYEGAKVNVNHPAGQGGQPRDYRDRIGSLRNVREESDGLYADLHYNPEHANAKQLAWDAQNAPENLGLSHNTYGRTTTKNGRTIVEAIFKVHSVDLVADPATVKGLFEGEQTVSDTITIETVRANAAIMEQLRADILRENTESETSKAQAAELKSLREQLDTLKAEKVAAEAKGVVAKLIESAKLPKEAVTEIFTEQLLAADEAGRKRLIEDRQAIWKSAGGGRGTSSTPRSKEQSLAEQQGSGGYQGAVPTDAKSFAAALIHG
jgi:hypothetical protein